MDPGLTQGAYQELARLLHILLAFPETRPDLAEELGQARADWFPGPPPPATADAGWSRFGEWFCLERRLASGGLPLDLFLAGEGGETASRWEEALRQSRVGFFLVQEAPSPGLFILQDPGRDETLHLYWPGTGAPPGPGSSLLGRLYPLRRDGQEPLFLPSPFLLLHEGAELGAALARDAARVRSAGLAVHLDQLDLERLLTARPLAAGGVEPLGPDLALPDLLERIQLFFDRYQFAGIEAGELLEQARRAGSFAEAFGDLLDELAFDTDADLNELRRLFLRLWQAARGQASPGEGQGARWAPAEGPCPCGSGRSYLECHLGRDLVSRLEEAEASAGSRAAVFEGLAAALGEEEDPEGETEAISARREGLQELEALVGEFAWERGFAGEGREVRLLRDLLAHLEGLAAEREPFRPRDLVGPGAHSWLLMALLVLPPEEARERLALAGPLLLDLGGWLAGAHGLEEAAARTARLQETLLPALARALAAAAALGEASRGSAAPPGARPAVYSVLPGRPVRAGRPGREEPPALLVEPQGGLGLEAGDLVAGIPLPTALGLLFPGRARVVPGALASLLDEAWLPGE